MGWATFWANFSKTHLVSLAGANHTSSGGNPTTLSYISSDVKIYSATNSKARFQNKNDFLMM
jgi:hypothetical protein